MESALPESVLNDQMQRVAEVRFTLMRLFPFYGHILANIPIEFAFVGTACATNEGRLGKVYLDPRFIATLRQGQLMAVLLHEITHILLNAFSRQGDRGLDGWNRAHDHADNLLIQSVKDNNPRLGIEFWDEPAPLLDEQFVGLTAETIYDRLMQAEPPQQQKREQSGGDGASDADEPSKAGGAGTDASTGDQVQPAENGTAQGQSGDPSEGHEGQGGPGDGGVSKPGAGAQGGIRPRNGGHGVGDATDLVRVPRPGMNRSQERMADHVQEQAIRNLLAEAVEMQALRRAGTMPGGLVEMVDAILKPPVPWVDQLFHAANGRLKGGTVSYASLSRRSAAFEDEGEGLVLPGRGRNHPCIAVITDNSLSVSTVELQEFLHVMRQITETNNAATRWIQVDAEIQSDEMIDDFDLGFSEPVAFVGRGGTVFDALPERLWDPAYDKVDLAVLLTDGEPSRWPDPKEWPVPLLVVTTQTAPPDGYEFIKLEIEED